MGLDSLEFSSVPDIFSRNPAVELVLTAKAGAVLVGLSKTPTINGDSDTLGALHDLWASIESSTVASLSSQTGLRLEDVESAIRLLWRAGGLIPGPKASPPLNERFWLARDPAQRPVRTTCHVSSRQPQLYALAAACLEGSGFNVVDDDEVGSATPTLWIDGAVPKSDQLVLPVRVNQNTAFIGPYFGGSPFGLCSSCIDAVLREPADQQITPRAIALWRLAIAVAVRRLSRLACGDLPDQIKNTVTIIDEDLMSRLVATSARSNCTGCLDHLGSNGASLSAPGAYELAAASYSPHRIAKRVPRFRASLGWRTIRTSMSGVPAGKDTPALAGARSVARSAGGPRLSVPTQRLTPSGGDLRSVDAFYIVPVPPGERSVVGFWSQDRLETHEKLIRTADVAEIVGCADAAVVTVADLHRLNWKYGDFCLKLALLDSGCSAAHGIAAAGEMGWRAKVSEGALTASQAVRDILTMASKYEFMSSVIRLYRPVDSKTGEPTPAKATNHSAVDRILTDAARPYELTSAAYPGVYNGKLMDTRHSVRALKSDRPIQFSDALSIADSIGSTIAGNAAVSLAVCAKNVATLEPGWYMYEKESGFRQINRSPQYVAGGWRDTSGPAVQYIVAADLESLDAAAYATTIVRSGRAVFNGWMHAIHAGYQGTVLGENNPKLWTEISGLPILRSRPLVSLSLSPSQSTRPRDE